MQGIPSLYGAPRKPVAAAPAPAPAPSYQQPYTRADLPPQYQTQGTPIPTYGGAPRPAAQPGSVVGAIRGAIPQRPVENPFSYLTDENQQYLNQYWNSLAGQDYKGSHESALMRRAQLAQLLNAWQQEGDIDYTGAAPIGRQFERDRDRLAAKGAALGQSGGTLMGALGDSYVGQGNAIGEYIRRMMADRQEQHHDDLQRFLDWSRQLDMLGLNQNIEHQNSGGFWGDLLGVGAGVLGKVL